MYKIDNNLYNLYNKISEVIFFVKWRTSVTRAFNYIIA